MYGHLQAQNKKTFAARLGIKKDTGKNVDYIFPSEKLSNTYGNDLLVLYSKKK